MDLFRLLAINNFAVYVACNCFRSQVVVKGVSRKVIPATEVIFRCCKFKLFLIKTLHFCNLFR